MPAEVIPIADPIDLARRAFCARVCEVEAVSNENMMQFAQHMQTEAEIAHVLGTFEAADTRRGLWEVLWPALRACHAQLDRFQAADIES